MAQLQKGTTYITGDQVTAANLNALVDSGILTPGAVTDQTAKTVPLAADTILLHSAADTALRKTTMTQLFATPQPLGATTPSSVAATTGTFSSTLGVTGVATLGNGAILGTPASGTVTNLTGTASININGTVGATTPSTVAATTVTATTSMSVVNASGQANSILDATSNDAVLRYKIGGVEKATIRVNNADQNLIFEVGASERGRITSTGLNSTAIGATTPSTGAFTSVAASLPLTLSGSTVGSSSAMWVGSDSVGGIFVNAPTGNSARIGVGNSGIAVFSAAGAAITGTLSATGVASFLGLKAQKATATSGFISAIDEGANVYNVLGSRNNADSAYLPLVIRGTTVTLGATSDIATINSTGLGIGTTSPAYALDIAGSAQVSSTNFFRYNGDTGIIGSATSITGGTSAQLGIRAASDILFATNGATERMRITNAGSVGIGTTDPAGSYLAKFASVSTSASNYAGVFYVNAASSDSIAAVQMSKSTNVNTSSQVFSEFYINAFGTASGRIVANGASAAAFASYSDKRLKENITDLPSQLNNILSLRPVEFDFKDGSGHQIGFIAQEVEEIYPDLIAKGKDDMLTLTGLSKNEARLIKAIQEQNAQIESLSARLAALESK